MKKNLLAAALALSTAVLSAADGNPTYDVDNFDISGMKLGMDEAAIKAALNTALGIGDSDISGGYDDDIEWQKGNHKVKVHFIADAWHDKADSRVADEIRYTLPYTDENRNMLAEAAVQKYGKPTQASGLGSYWCTVGGLENGLCVNKAAELTLRDSRTVGAVYLTLTDTRYKKAVQVAQNQNKTEKPKI